MTSLDQLLYDISKTEEDDVEDFLENYFHPKKREQYMADERFEAEDYDSLEMMFQDYDLIDKAYDALDVNPFCMEAFVVVYKLESDVSLFNFFNDFNDKDFDYNSLSEYHKYVYGLIESYYVDFLINIRNLTGAKNVLLNLLNKDERLYEGNLFRLSYLYSCLEDLDSFYNLYLDSGFKEAFSYILLLVVCLKHGDKQKAKEVFGEFLSSFKYASYIDHIWDLDDNDEDGAVEMRMTMSACYSEICSIPNFFSWCEENKEGVRES